MIIRRECKLISAITNIYIKTILRRMENGMSETVVQKVVTQYADSDIQSFFNQRSKDIHKVDQTSTNDNGLDLFLSDTAVLDKQVYNLVNSNKAAGILFQKKTITGHKKLWEFKTSGKVMQNVVNSKASIDLANDSNDITVNKAAKLIFKEKNKVTEVIKRWEFETGGWVGSSPCVDGKGTVYVGSRDYKLYAIDGATGKKRWEFETGSWVDSSPCVDGKGTVYVGSADGKLYAIDGATGKKRWEFKTGGEMDSSPCVDDNGTVYVGSYDDKIYALKYVPEEEIKTNDDFQPAKSEPRIEFREEWVIIGDTKVRVRK